MITQTSKITEHKAKIITNDYGYTITGYVFTNKKGHKGILDEDSVRWLTKEEMKELLLKHD